MTATLPAVVQFDGQSLDIINIDDTPWLRGPQIAGALGYGDPKAITTLHERNAAEFTETETRLVEVDTAGGKQTVRVFSPRGCYLIGFLSRTPKSKQFRRWALDVLDAFRTGQTERVITVKEHKRKLARDKAETKPALAPLPAPRPALPSRAINYAEVTEATAKLCVGITRVKALCEELETQLFFPNRITKRSGE